MQKLFIFPSNFHLILCNSSRTTGCKCRLHKPIDNDDPAHYTLKHEHSHPGEARKIGKQRVMSKLKDLAKTTQDPATVLIAGSVQGEQKSTIASLPSTKQMAKTVQRQRKGPGFPKNPNSLAELQLNGEYRVTNSGENFILFDSGVNDEIVDDRTIIFGTKENVEFMAKCEEIFMDGTFSVSPPLFAQVYIIHGNYRIKFIIKLISFSENIEHLVNQKIIVTF